MAQLFGRGRGSFRIRKSVRLGRGWYATQSYSGDEAVAIVLVLGIFALALGLIAFALNAALLLAAFVASVLIYVFVFVCNAALYVLRACYGVAKRLLIATYRLLGFTAKATALTGMYAASSAGRTAKTGASTVASGIQNARQVDFHAHYEDARIVIGECWQTIHSIHERLPEWGKPIAWGVCASVPILSVLILILKIAT